MYIEILQQNGFSDKEAKIYLANLSLGSSPASRIARKCEEKRLTTYATLKKLVKKGFVSQITQNNTQYFEAISPKLLLNKIKSENQYKLEQLKNVLGDMEQISQNNFSGPKVKFYEGFEGIKSMYEDSINSSYQDVIIGKQEMDPRFADYLYDRFVPERIAKGMEVRVIYSNKYHHDLVHKNKPKEDLREVFVLDNDLFNIGNVFFLHSGDKLSITMFASHEMSGITIQSQTLHDSFKSIFEMLWLAYKK